MQFVGAESQLESCVRLIDCMNIRLIRLAGMEA